MIPGTAIKTGQYTTYIKLNNPSVAEEIPENIWIGNTKIRLIHKYQAICPNCKAAGDYN